MTRRTLENRIEALEASSAQEVWRPAELSPEVERLVEKAVNVDVFGLPSISTPEDEASIAESRAIITNIMEGILRDD